MIKTAKLKWNEDTKMYEEVTMPCYYENIADYEEMKRDKLKCKPLSEFEDWLLIHPRKLKEKLTSGLDDLLKLHK